MCRPWCFGRQPAIKMAGGSRPYSARLFGSTDIMYKCLTCDNTMSRPHGKCPSCGVWLSGVRCEVCQYVGTKEAFIANNHQCPNCGSRAQIASSTTASQHRPPKKTESSRSKAQKIVKSYLDEAQTRWGVGMVFFIIPLFVYLEAVTELTDIPLAWVAPVSLIGLIIVIWNRPICKRFEFALEQLSNGVSIPDSVGALYPRDMRDEDWRTIRNFPE